MSVTIRLSLPPKGLHAHNKGSWKSKAGPTRRYREEAFVVALGSKRKFKRRAVLSIDFYWPDLRRRDSLTAAQGLKPAIDGLVDAKMIRDDNWQALSIGHIESHLDREKPRVELTLTDAT